MITVDLNPLHKFNYNEISNLNFCMALLTPEFRLLHNPVQCKDYFQDMFWSEHMNSNACVYGLTWTPGRIDISKDRFYLLLLGGMNETLRDKIESTQKFINFFDVAQGIPLTIMHETPDEHNIVIEFSGEWTTSSAMLSAFTTIVRISGPYTITESAVEFLDRVSSLDLADFNIRKSLGRSYVDISRLTVTKQKLFALLSGSKVSMKWKYVASGNSAHVNGIYGYRGFPRVDVVTEPKKVKPLKFTTKDIPIGSTVTGTIDNQEFTGMVTYKAKPNGYRGFIHVLLPNDEGFVYVFSRDITSVTI